MVRKSHFDVTACAEARRLARRDLSSLWGQPARWKTNFANVHIYLHICRSESAHTPWCLLAENSVLTSPKHKSYLRYRDSLWRFNRDFAENQFSPADEFVLVGLVAGVSILRYFSRTLLIIYCWFYKKLGPFYKKLNCETMVTDHSPVWTIVHLTTTYKALKRPSWHLAWQKRPSEIQGSTTVGSSGRCEKAALLLLSPAASPSVIGQAVSTWGWGNWGGEKKGLGGTAWASSCSPTPGSGGVQKAVTQHCASWLWPPLINYYSISILGYIAVIVVSDPMNAQLQPF